MSYQSEEVWIIYLSSALALFWALYNTAKVKSIQLSSNDNDDEENESLADNKIEMIKNIGEKISNGANSFLF